MPYETRLTERELNFLYSNLYHQLCNDKFVSSELIEVEDLVAKLSKMSNDWKKPVKYTGIL